jgi:hypothetical protein
LAAILADQLKTALIEPADETFEDSNIFLKLVQRRHLQFQIHSGKSCSQNLSKPYASTEGVTKMTGCRLSPNPQAKARSGSVA